MKQESYKKRTWLNVIKKNEFEKDVYGLMEAYDQNFLLLFSEEDSHSLFFGKTTLIKEKNTSQPSVFSLRILGCFP